MLDGKDPSTARKLEKVNPALAKGNTFGLLVGEYIERLERRGASERTLDKNRWLLETLAGPALGDRPIGEITPVEILAVQVWPWPGISRHACGRRLWPQLGRARGVR